MAAPLDRTWYNTLIDDDGTGTTGTVWNKFQVDGLLDTVDGSLAGLVDRSGTPSLAQVAVFTDADTLVGYTGLTFGPNPGVLTISGNANYTVLILEELSQPANARQFRMLNASGALQIGPHDDLGGQQAINLRLTRDGLVHLDSGRMRFPSTQIPSADPYTIDDYREITWTPRLGGSGGESGQTYSQQSGRGVKIGRWVHLTGFLQLTTIGTITGGVQIKDLPLPTSPSGTYSPAIVEFYGIAPAIVKLGAYVELGATAIRLFVAGDGYSVGYHELVAADLNPSCYFMLNISYETTQ